MQIKIGKKTRLSITHEAIQLLRTDPHYESWGIQYSNGLAYDSERRRALWCWPKLTHCDVRKFLPH